MMLNSIFNPGSTGGVGGAMFGNSPSAAGSDADSPLGPSMNGAIDNQIQAQLAALQQFMTGY